MIQIKLKYTKQRIEVPNLHISWGDIVGDVSGNTALQDALDGKQDVGNYATHNDLSTVEDSLQNIINQTKDDIDSKLDKKANKSDVYAKEDADSRFQSVGDYALKSELPTIPLFKTINGQSITGSTDNITIEGGSGADLTNYYTKSESDNKYALKNSIPTNIYTKTEVDNKLSNKLDVTAYTPTDLTDYAKTEDVNTELTKKQDKGNYVSATTLNDYALKSEIPSVEGLATESYVSNKIKEVVGTAPEALDTLGEIADKLSGDDDAIAAINQVLDEKVSKEDYNTNQQAITNSLTDLSNNKADKSEIPTIPLFRTINGQAITGSTDNITIDTDLTDYYTKTESDNKYALKGDIPTDVYTKTQVDSKLSEKLDVSAYTKYDDSKVKADIQANAIAIEGKQDKGNYANVGDSYTKQESDAKYLTEHQSLTAYAKTADVNTELSKKQDKGDYALKSELPTIPLFKTINGQAITGSTDNITIESGSDIELPISSDDVAFFSDDLEVKSELHIGDTFTSRYIGYYSNYGYEFTFEFDGGYEIWINEPTIGSFKGFESVTKNGTIKYNGTYYAILDLGKKYTLTLTSMSNEMSGESNNYAITLGQASKSLTNAFNEKANSTDVYTKTEIDNMVGNINNALNGLSFWKGTQEEYDAIATKDNNTIYYII